MSNFDPKTHPALSHMDTHILTDGTRVWFDLKTSDGTTLRFSVNPEALGILIRNLKSTAGTVSKNLHASGNAAKYQSGKFEMAPERVLTIAIGTEGVEARKELMLAIQTEDGALSRLVVPTDKALEIAGHINRLKGKLDPGSTAKSKH
jgi:hypothetical protein